MQIAFAILCGGRSVRMGTTKALLPFAGTSMLSRIARAGDGFGERYLSVNDMAIVEPEGFVRVSDLYPEQGPLSGIHAVLRKAEADAVLFVPCDVPFVTREFVRYLADQAADCHNGLVCESMDGFVEPLFAVYSRSQFHLAEQMLADNRNKVMEFVCQSGCDRLPISSSQFPNLFFNINTPKDFRYLSEFVDVS